MLALEPPEMEPLNCGRPAVGAAAEPGTGVRATDEVAVAMVSRRRKGVEERY